MITKVEKIPKKDITSIDITSSAGGLYLGGAQNAPVNSFTRSKDVELTLDGYAIPRRKRVPFLPDTVGVSYQKFPALWNGKLYYFTADDQKAKFCQEGDTSWTDCGGDNTVTTNAGGMTKFVRVLDCILIINGRNGDKLAYIDLSTAGFPVVKYTKVDDPTLAPTTSLEGLTTGAQNIYYAYNYSGNIGETLLSPIQTQSINHMRDDWATLSTPGSITIQRTGTVPAGAQYWNLYVALASTAGSIRPEDMLLVAAKLDLATNEFIDNGTLSIQLGAVAPAANSTDGPRVDQGVVADGRPVLYMDYDNLYNVWIGGPGPYAMDFSISNGGYRAEPEKGTNYYPTTVIGFRTGQGIPSLTMLYSNTEGLSKQAVLQQQQVNYGEQSFTVWGITEQHYGAAGVAAPNSAINYNGKLLFLSTDGFLSMETQASIQNVLSTLSIGGPVDELVRSIKNRAMGSVVGTGWNNKYMWLVPSRGFDTPQQILILDTNNKGIEGNGAWYTLNIPADWIGVVSPQDSAAFVYLSQGNKTFKLMDSSSTFDTVDGNSAPFSTNITGPLVGTSGAAHNTWQASVQVMFYLLKVVGEVEIGVNYRDLGGKLKTKSRIIHGPAFTPSVAGGYGDPQWTYSYFPQIPGYGSTPQIESTNIAVTASDLRKPVIIDDIFNEAQWFIRTPIGFNYFQTKAVSFEGINLGVRPDLQ